jgi:hypothetical protein
VTLEKTQHMAYGAEYEDHFVDPGLFVWSSQTSVGPETKKGREIIDSPGSGTLVHLWTRRRKADVGFTYLGLVVPVDHQGDRPMSVRFRMLTPVEAGVWKRLVPGAR